MNFRRNVRSYPTETEQWNEDLREEDDDQERAYQASIHEGEYVAEVKIELVHADEGWSPYLSMEDAYKLDDVREALRRGDIKRARRMARVFRLTPVNV